MEKDKVSILMPVYNASPYLNEAIESIIGQTYKNLELILVNDKSTDDSEKIIKNWQKKDPRIILIENKYEKGIWGSLNSAIDILNGDLIARADADDVQKKDRLEFQVNFLNKYNEIDLIGGGFRIFGNNIRPKNIYNYSNNIKLFWKFITNTYFCHPSIMFRKKILDSVPYYPKEASEDFAFFSQIIKIYKTKNVKKILLDYRQHLDNYSNTKKEEIISSVLSTSQKNYFFYLNTLDGFEKFYKFHANNILKFSDLLEIFKISIKIAKKISKQYKNKNSIINFIYLLILIKIQILKSLARYYLKKIK